MLDIYSGPYWLRCGGGMVIAMCMSGEWMGGWIGLKIHLSTLDWRTEIRPCIRILDQTSYQASKHQHRQSARVPGCVCRIVKLLIIALCLSGFNHHLCSRDSDTRTEPPPRFSKTEVWRYMSLSNPSSLFSKKTTKVHPPIFRAARLRPLGRGGCKLVFAVRYLPN